MFSKGRLRLASLDQGCRMRIWAEEKKMAPKGGHSSFSSGGAIAFAPSGLSYVGRLRQPRSAFAR